MDVEENNKPLDPNELVEAMAPHTAHSEKVGEMRDNDTVNDKQAKTLQTPVLSAANAVVKLKLARDAYRAKWRYKDTHKADKWAHKDKVRQMRKDRRELVKSRKDAIKAARNEKRKAQKTAKEEKRKAQKAAKAAKRQQKATETKR